MTFLLRWTIKWLIRYHFSVIIGFVPIQIGFGNHSQSQFLYSILISFVSRGLRWQKRSWTNSFRFRIWNSWWAVRSCRPKRSNPSIPTTPSMSGGWNHRGARPTAPPATRRRAVSARPVRNWWRVCIRRWKRNLWNWWPNHPSLLWPKPIQMATR